MQPAEIQNNSIFISFDHYIPVWLCLSPHKDTLRTVTHSPPIVMFGYPVHDFFLFNGLLSKGYSRAKAEPIRLNQKMMREGRQWDDKLRAFYPWDFWHTVASRWSYQYFLIGWQNVSLSADVRFPVETKEYHRLFCGFAVSDMICVRSTKYSWPVF